MKHNPILIYDWITAIHTRKKLIKKNNCGKQITPLKVKNKIKKHNINVYMKNKPTQSSSLSYVQGYIII